ncbi:MAG: hypothetical protein WCV99_23915 [Sterolibacterium sp.]
MNHLISGDYDYSSTWRFLAALLLSVLLIFLALASCNESKVKWQEEVKLSTGEIIKIDREVKHRGGGAAWPQGQGSVPMEHLIRFRYPAQIGPLIEWRSTKLEPQGTYAELPLVLDLSAEKTWFIFTRHWITGACVQYVKYQYQNGAWTEPPLAEDIDTHPTNLFLAADSNEIEGLISLAEKAQENASMGYPKHLRKVGPKRKLCIPNDNF